MAASPAGPVQEVRPVLARRRYDGAVQPRQLGHGDRDHLGGAGSGVLCPFEGNGDGEVDVGEQAQRGAGLPSPATVAAAAAALLLCSTSPA